LQQGKFSSRELTQHYLKRIEKIDAQVKSYVTVTPEQALAKPMLPMPRSKQAMQPLLQGFRCTQRHFLYPRH
jgi:Asp-tRNA(Asn)/Glu-tRNA(Gln) amidotransferase A subunit family amidase